MVRAMHSDFGGVDFGIDSHIDRDIGPGFTGLVRQVRVMNVNIGIETQPV